jgi:uncharacterized damage-inducible protein DinB
MKEIYGLLADYNAQVNRQMLDILDKAPAGLLTRDAGSYFGSILGVLEHVLRADLSFVNRLRPAHGFKALESAAAAYDPATAPKQLYDNYAALAARRKQVDEVILALVEELTEDILLRDVPVPVSAGESEPFAVWQILLQTFNHQAHHRGEIAQILDAAGVENDFSRITPVIRARRAKG